MWCVTIRRAITKTLNFGIIPKKYEEECDEKQDKNVKISRMKFNILYLKSRQNNQHPMTT